MRYLAIDLGTNTGVAFNHKGLIAHSCWKFTSRRGGVAPGRGISHYGERFRKFQGCLEAHHKVLPVEHILFEDVRAHRGTRAAHIYGGFLAVLAAWAEFFGIPLTGVGVGTIKRRVTGKGNASKKEVMNACRARGYSPLTFDEADALALLLGVLEIESNETQTKRIEADANQTVCA